MQSKDRIMVREHLDLDLLLERLELLGQVGHHGQSELGRSRMALTAADKAGRDLLCQWIVEAGLELKVDAIGNIFGVLNGTGPTLMLGSHIDTVPYAGNLDGCYGVLSGLALAQAIKQAKLGFSLVVAAFTNEEGTRFQPDMMGSLVYVGGLGLEDALNSKSTDGACMGDELESIGYAGKQSVPYPNAYLELHVEQGPMLAATCKDIGIVQGVQGISWQKITLHGMANHAGTTPWNQRCDACVGAARIMEGVVALCRNTSTLATVGSLKLLPGEVNVIAHTAEFTLDMRDPDSATLVTAEKQVKELVQSIAKEEGLEATSQILARFEPVPFYPSLVGIVEKNAKMLDCSHMFLYSGAGHDAQMLARICPAAMIFVPSRGGISHNPAEYTHPYHLKMGAMLLLECALDFFAEGAL